MPRAKSKPRPEPRFVFGASLRVFGQSLDFGELERRLGVAPTISYRKGAPCGLGSRSREFDMWLLAAPAGREQPLSRHLDALWKAVKPNVSYLKKLKRTHTVDIYCRYFANVPSAGFEIDCSSLEMFRALDLSFGVSVLVLDEGVYDGVAAPAKRRRSPR